jgi:precorrin-2 dehydrogenase / sirohydrochlorin ferrochelatase
VPLVVALDLGGQVAVVVGGGGVAERKVATLLEAGARVRVVSPALSPVLQARWQQGAIEWLARRYEAGDQAGAFLAVACTGVQAVDAAVAAEAYRAGRLVCVSGEPGLGNVQFTAEVHRGPVTVAVSTGGASPALAARMRDEIARAVGPEYGDLAGILAEARAKLKATAGLSQGERAQALTAIVQGPVLEMLARGEVQAAQNWVANVIQAAMGVDQ